MRVLPVYKIQPETKLLSKISQIIIGLVATYLVIRIIDVMLKGGAGLAFEGDIKGNMFLLENLMLLIGLLFLIPSKNRERPRRLFNAAFFLMLGGGLYRINTYLVGFDPGPGGSYFPSVGEIMITLGIIAAELMGYMWFIKKFPVLAGSK